MNTKLLSNKYTEASESFEQIKLLKNINSKLIRNNSQTIIDYSKFTDIISELENKISKDAETSLAYALFNNVRFEEGEKSIIENYKYSYKYSSIFFEDSRWEKAESNILKSIKYSYLYTRDVIKTRWTELENKIISKKSFEDEHLFEKYILKYINLFQTEQKRFYELEEVLGEKLSGEKLLEYWKYYVPAGKLSDSGHNKLLGLGVAKPSLVKEYFDSLDGQRLRFLSYLQSINIDHSCTIKELLDYVSQTSIR